MSTITIYDATGDVWTPNTGASINPVLPVEYKAINAADGSLKVLNNAAVNYAGGLVSVSKAIPAGAQFFGLDVTYLVQTGDLAHLARNEMDLKITTADGSSKAIPNQANFSAQQNADASWHWQLDPTGTGWVDSGYAPGPPAPDVPQTMQFRYWTDGAHWSVLGMCANGGTPFVPGAQFENIPMLTTNWTAGILAQLQTACIVTPWFLMETYLRVRIMASDQAIPWSLA
jgi:hypothetical protein